jgi:putative transposase
MEAESPARRQTSAQAPASVSPGNGIPIQAVYPGHVWTYDFVHNHCLNRTPLKVLTVMDEFPGEGLAIAVATTMPSERVRTVLAGLFAQHGAPAYRRSDNGPECIAENLCAWLVQQQTATVYIDRGCPWQNGSGESVGGTRRDEYLNLYAFVSVAEACVILERYRRSSIEERPQSSLRSRTPAEFNRDWRNNQSSTQDSTIPT